ncbi:hypothetical protein KUTeg_009227 [Tegillarca granosa]|uniref:aspartate transaminase n=1 Tax=Tegillarca granosa TaxID=220873 RepID=A0ABQ9F784_TEGGR|nr:hypothetical protein KUTeg_009227 [Tegillarca granosa]
MNQDMASEKTLFSDIEVAPPIEVFNLTDKFKADEYKQKINLGVGAYRSEEGKPWVLPIVRAVEARVTTDETYNHEYLPVAGFPDYREAAYKLLLGSESPALRSNRVDSIQTCGGTGAIRVAADFLKQQLGFNTVYVSKPTWGNHRGIFKAAGFQNVKDYRYWDAANRDVDLKGWMEDLDEAPEKSVIILHACAHNPTGMDPTHEQWTTILNKIKHSHSLKTLACTVNERVGNLVFITNDVKNKEAIKSQMELIVRVTWSNPPSHGAKLVAAVLNSADNFAIWKKNVKTMSDRIVLMRTKLYEKLKDLNTPGDWKHIIKQKGMFSFTGLNPSQVDRLIKKHHIYLLKNGRINMCALTLGNLEYVANCMHTVICEEQQQQTAKI